MNIFSHFSYAHASQNKRGYSAEPPVLGDTLTTPANDCFLQQS